MNRPLQASRHYLENCFGKRKREDSPPRWSGTACDPCRRASHYCSGPQGKDDKRICSRCARENLRCTWSNEPRYHSFLHFEPPVNPAGAVIEPGETIQREERERIYREERDRREREDRRRQAQRNARAENYSRRPHARVATPASQEDSESVSSMEPRRPPRRQDRAQPGFRQPASDPSSIFIVGDTVGLTLPRFIGVYLDRGDAMRRAQAAAQQYNMRRDGHHERVWRMTDTPVISNQTTEYEFFIPGRVDEEEISRGKVYVAGPVTLHE